MTALGVVLLNIVILFLTEKKCKTNIKFKLLAVKKRFQLITLLFFSLKNLIKIMSALVCINIKCNFKRLRLHSSISITKPKQHLNINKEIKIVEDDRPNLVKLVLEKRS